MSETTCQHCRHWIKQPLDPHNLAAGPQGECREQLHSVLLPTPQGPVCISYYPRVAQDMNACSRLAPRITLETA